MKTYTVITSIQAPTDSVKKLVQKLMPTQGRLLVIGDTKSPERYELDNTEFYSLDKQLSLPFKLASRLPTEHYSRKNIGYLIAISEGASSIYETDDDNAPLESWGYREKQIDVRKVCQSGWVNIFQAFSDELIWPRGFPLSEIKVSVNNKLVSSEEELTIDAPIQQGLAEGSPDVDAVWRLAMDKEIHFNGDDSYYLPVGAWCPFNSQSTWWWPEAYPLLYLPSFCSFRMTDIWRGFIAQRCLWAMGYGLVFHPPEVYQERNKHDLMKDFTDEIPGYQRNQELIKLLTDLELDNDKMSVGSNMLHCYNKLVEEEFFTNDELILVHNWLDDLDAIQSNSLLSR